MASRRDELNAYTFAKKRTIAAFLQPSPAGTDEGAPRPLQAVLPSLVVGALILAGFGAWGMFKPKAPKGWDTPGAHVIIGSDSTTRYVVLKTGDTVRLHPVLNFASAKLLLDPDKSSVIKVAERELDSGKIQRGATLGIPYAPDRMPSGKEAGKNKLWAACEQPGGDGKAVQKAVFLLADREAKFARGKEQLRGGDALYVEGPDGARHLITPQGTRHLIGSTKGESVSPADQVLLRSLFVEGAQPQRVTKDWLATLHEGTPITFPKLPGRLNAPAAVAGLDGDLNRVGMVLRAQTGNQMQQYVVLPGRVAPVSDLVARLLLSNPDAKALGQNGRPKDVGTPSFITENDPQWFAAENGWPTSVPTQANGTGSGARDTVCSVLNGVDAKGATQLTTWAGTEYPAKIIDGATSAYVTPGTGLLYRQFQGSQTESGSIFLVTDTGLRYAVQANNDSSTDTSKIGSDGKPLSAEEKARNVNQAQTRLGYKDVKPVPVPENWSEFLPKGPRLDTNSAKQPQSS
ncbi:type VII secretion protein EccB [Streptomyces sp. URMC 123]|uniref:type VII secretion protein EccB n=1 Tax=Streptomyces sp. URMC 123 TaxID=3423403 RepID=UPI003F1A6B88